MKLGNRYSLTATGIAAGAGNAYIYENVGGPCSATLAVEKKNKIAISFGSETLTGAGAFSLTTPARSHSTQGRSTTARI